MITLTLQLEPLTKAAFAPYGEVIETQGAQHFGMNDDTLERYYDLATVDVDHRKGGRVVVSITTCKKVSALPYQIPCIERHPLGSQAFIPLDNHPLIVAVAEPSTVPDPTKIKAFISNGLQGVNYHKNVWHMPAICLDARQKMLIIDRGGKGNNCDIFELNAQRIVLKR